MEKINLSVTGMSCHHCEKSITNALEDLGVAYAKADSSSGKVEVEFNPQIVNLEEIKKEIVETGYRIVNL